MRDVTFFTFIDGISKEVTDSCCTLKCIEDFFSKNYKLKIMITIISPPVLKKSANHLKIMQIITIIMAQVDHPEPTTTELSADQTPSTLNKRSYHH